MKSMNPEPRWPAIVALVAAMIALSLASGCGGGDDGGMEPEPEPLPSPGVLRVGDAEGTPGSTVQLSLSLENAVRLSGIQFDLDVDPDILTVTGVGPTARSAGFEAAVNADSMPAHILLVDLEGSATIAPGDGPVATVTVAVAPTASGTSPLLIDHATAVDVTATTLSLGGSEATFTVR